MKAAWMTSTQAATYLAVNEGTLRNWRAAGDGPPYVKLPGGAIRYNIAQVDAWLHVHAQAVALGDDVEQWLKENAEQAVAA